MQGYEYGFMARNNIGKWERREYSPPDSRLQDREYIRYEHRDLPIRVIVYEGEGGAWFVSGDIRGTHEVTIGGYRESHASKQAALEVAYDWMRRHKHPARLVTEDRDMREGEARERHEMGQPEHPGGLFEDLF